MNGFMQWTPERLIQLLTPEANPTSSWVVDLPQQHPAFLANVAETVRPTASAPAAKSWRDVDTDRPWEGLEAVHRQIDVLLHERHGVAVVRCGAAIDADVARAIEIVVGSTFGKNVSMVPEEPDRPLFEISAKPKEGKQADAIKRVVYRGNGKNQRPIGFHTDGSGTADRRVEVLGLLCIRPARFGGCSRIANSHAARFLLPECVQSVLRKTYPRMSPYEESQRPEALQLRPIYGPRLRDDVYEFSFHPERVRQGLEIRDGFVTAEAEEAIAALEAALEASSVDVNLHANEILFVNNLCVAHDRSAFRDQHGVERTLERFWAGCSSESAPVASSAPSENAR